MFKRTPIVHLSDIYIASHDVIRPARGKPYTTFKIVSTSVDGKQYTVNRRYSQFVQLNGILSSAFPRDRIQLPKKRRVLSNFTPSFLLAREQALTHYLGELLRRPALSRLRIVSEFLTLLEWSSASTVRSALTSQAEAQALRNRQAARQKQQQQRVLDELEEDRDTLGLLGDAGPATIDKDAAFTAALRELADLRMPSEVREQLERERGLGVSVKPIESSGSDDEAGPLDATSPALHGTMSDRLSIHSGGRRLSTVGTPSSPGRPRTLSSLGGSLDRTRTRPLSLTRRSSTPDGEGLADWAELDRRHLTLDDAFEWRDVGRRCSGTYRRPRDGRRMRVTVFVLAPGLVATTRHRWNLSAQLVSRFKSDNVLKLLGVVSDDPPLFVQELGEHGTLNAVLRRLADPPFPTDPPSASLLIGFCEGVANGLAYLHDQHRFIHGSVCSYAVEVGRHNVPKLSVLDTEFGVSQKRWSAPSLLCGADLTMMHDVWAFGVLCIEVFSGGQLPFEHLGDEEVYDRVMNAYYSNVNGGRDVDSSNGVPVHERPDTCPVPFWKTVVEPCFQILDSARPSASILGARIRDVLPQVSTHADVDAVVDVNISPITAASPAFSGHLNGSDPTYGSPQRSSLSGSPNGAAGVWAHAQAPPSPANGTLATYEDESEQDVANI
eukprot:m.183922 g.183922  ORF g.183922 m.183922 type:complete len:665 (-) comp15972_c0_seq1:103-2097(-)